MKLHYAILIKHHCLYHTHSWHICTYSWHGTSTALMVFGPGKTKPLCLNKPGADNVQSVSFRANSPVMEFCLIVFDLKISLTRAQTQLWYFCVLSQFCSAESWLEPDRSNVFQKALRTIFSSRCSFIFDYFRVCFINCHCHLRGWGVDEDPVHLFPFYFNVCFMNCHYRLKRGVDEGPLLTPFPSLNYSGKMDVSLRQIVPGISYRDQTGLQINVSEKWDTGVKKIQKGGRVLGYWGFAGIRLGNNVRWWGQGGAIH